MLGKMKDYQIKTIFKFIAKKEGFGLAESTAVQKEEQQGTVLEALKNGGNVFGIYKKKELQACYVFERAKVMENEIPYPKYDLNKENAWDFITGHDVQEPEAPVEESEEETGFFGELKEDLDEMIDSVADTDEEEDDQKNKEVTVLRLKEVYNHTVPAEVLEEFEKAILTEFKELILLDEVKAIIWNERILVPKKVKVGGLGYINALPLGMMIGVAFGVAIDNIALGISLGMLWGIAFGSLFTTITSAKNKNGRA